jgi:hypothetical protein
MELLKTWLARIVIVIAGVWTIVVGAGDTTSGNGTAWIVTGIAAILFAVYATIRGLSGEAKGEKKQVIGLINLEKWYDFVVVGILIVIVIIAWVAT